MREAIDYRNATELAENLPFYGNRDGRGFFGNRRRANRNSDGRAERYGRDAHDHVGREYGESNRNSVDEKRSGSRIFCFSRYACLCTVGRV